ncbi:MAG: DUF4214 domain-containing protein [Roseivivax sp.]|nr:DUF4214 domain-containing protein [Roseivivax sp.]
MATIQVAAASGTENSNIDFVVSLSRAEAAAVTVGYRILRGSAADSDLYYGYTPSRYNGTLTFAPGDTSQTVSVFAASDSTDEYDENIVLELYDPSSNATLSGGTPVLRTNGTILDDDGVGSNTALFVSDPVIVEGDSGQTFATFELRLSRPATSSTTVTYSTQNLSAVAGSDYTATSGSVTFTAGQDTKTVQVPVLGDTANEGNESFALVVSAPSGILVPPANLAGVATIINDDATPPVSISVASAAAYENNNLRFVVTLSEPAVDAVTVYYRTLPGSALDGDTYYDFTSAQNSGSVTFAPGQTSADIYVFATSDSIDEMDENILLELYDPTANAILDGGAPVLRANGTILDDDGVGPNQALFVSDPVLVEGDSGQVYAEFQVRLSTPATSSLTVGYATRDISAVAGSDYTAASGSLTFAAGEDIKIVRVAVTGDTAAEANEMFELLITAPGGSTLPATNLAGVATIVDDDPAQVPTVTAASAVAYENNNLRFVLTLSEPAVDVVTVNYRTLPGSALDGDTYYDFTSQQNNGTVTFAPGQTSAEVWVFATSDSTDEMDENIVLELYDVSSNAALDGGAPVVRVNGTILDDDGVGPNQALFVSDPVLVEGDSGQTYAEFEIRLSTPAASAFSVSYVTRDISALAGEDYTATSGSLSFAPGEDVKTVRVPVLGDTADESTESFSLVIVPPSGSTLPADNLAGTATILNDDAAGATISVSSAMAYENNNLRFVVTLSEPAANAVTVNYRTLPGTAVDGDTYYDFTSQQNNGTLTFAPGQTSAEVWVFATSDSTDEYDESIVLELYDPTGSATLDGGAPVLRANGTILDDDGAGPNRALFVSSPVVTEGAEGTVYAEFELRLSTPASSALTVGYATRDLSATAGSDYTAASGNATFEAGETVKTVRVAVAGDCRLEPAEAFALDVTVPTGTILATDGLSGMATILDDDTDGGPSISISAGQAVENNNIRYVVTLSEASAQAVTVDWQAGLGTAAADDLYYGLTSANNMGTLTFAPGETSLDLYTFANSDSADERDESVTMTLSNAVNGVLADNVTALTATGFILDDDGVGLNRLVQADAAHLREVALPSQVEYVTVRLSRPATSAMDFAVTVQDQTATLNADYRLLTNTVHFGVGQSEAAVAIEVLGDQASEGSETFLLKLAATSGSTYPDAVQDQVITIENGPSLPTGANETLTGTAGRDVIAMQGGNDVYYGLAQCDYVRGDDGNDTLFGGSGGDTLLGGSGADLLVGEAYTGGFDPFAGQVFRLYQATLARRPDLAGHTGWVANLAGGGNLQAVANGFVASQEFQNTYGGQSSSAFVTLLYNNVLNRAPDAGGLAGWVSLIDSGQRSRAEVVVGFSESAEFIQSTAVGALQYSQTGLQGAWVDDVFRLYNATLGRDPDASGMRGWSDQLAAGRPFLQVVNGFVASTEFTATYGSLDDNGFVTLLYNNVLGRAPDSAGLAGWVNQLASGTSREQVVQGFAQSQEFINNTRGPLAVWMSEQEADVLEGGSGNDTLLGGIYRDTFVFDADDDGSDVVVDLESWDTLEFRDFGYASASDARSHMTQSGANVVFDDQGVTVQVLNVLVADIADGQILV